MAEHRGHSVRRARPRRFRHRRSGKAQDRSQGTVDLLPHTPFALSPEERAEGLILACRALPTSDAGVAWLDGADEIAEMPVRRLSGRLVEVVDATHDIKLLRVALEKREGWDFRAGQYVRLAYPGAPARDYSMANRPDEEFIEFHVRQVPGGAASQIIARTAQVGDPLVVEGPFGSAFLREGHAGPILAVAGGSGLAPVKAIVETAIAKGMKQPIHVYFGVRTARDLYLIDRFAVIAGLHANVCFVPVLSEETAGGFRSGYVSDAIAADIADLDGWKAYVAGPPAMIDSVGPVLLERGIRSADIHADVFFTPDRNAA